MLKAKGGLNQKSFGTPGVACWRVSYDSQNPLKTKLVDILFRNSVRTSKRTPHFTITKINWLTLFKFNPLKPKLV